jgi:hypothetical protein
MIIIWSSFSSFLYSFRVLAIFWPPCSYPRLTYPESSCLLFVSAFFSFLSSCLSLCFSLSYLPFISFNLPLFLTLSPLLIALSWFSSMTMGHRKYENLKRLLESLMVNNALVDCSFRQDRSLKFRFLTRQWIADFCDWILVRKFENFLGV